MHVLGLCCCVNPLDVLTSNHWGRLGDDGAVLDSPLVMGDQFASMNVHGVQSGHRKHKSRSKGKGAKR